jgi:ankyrin repeat protein
MRTFPHPLSVVLLALLLGTLPGCATPLQGAAYRGDSQRVRALLDQGDREGIDLALFQAACYGRTEMAQLLLERGASVNSASPLGSALSVMDFRGYSALQCAALQGHDQMVSLLLSYGAKPDYKGEPGMTAQDLAKQKGYASIVKLLEDAQAARPPTATPPSPSSAPPPPPPIY